MGEFFTCSCPLARDKCAVEALTVLKMAVAMLYQSGSDMGHYLPTIAVKNETQVENDLFITFTMSAYIKLHGLSFTLLIRKKMSCP